jgi:beta-ribofuranosylaminobenzene 5'-phosphate synthase
MDRVQVSVGGRLHVGFQNLSLAHQRLYGGLGVGIDAPEVVVEATPSDAVDVDDDSIRQYVVRACDHLGVPGASVRVLEHIPRHVGLGSGTRLALATYVAIARAHDLAPDVRAAAPVLGRAGRSGVGVATFEAGGFVIDGGHRTDRFTTEPPAEGEWTVPPVLARHRVPDAWRFVLAIPDAPRGRSDAEEDRSIRRVVERAAPDVADEISGVTIRQLLPAVARDDVDAFGTALAAVERLNGTWYADEQGGVFRPPAGDLVSELSGSPAVEGAGQSSWGPVVYGVTDASRADRARRDAEAALAALDVGGEVTVARPDNEGATVIE